MSFFKINAVPIAKSNLLVKSALTVYNPLAAPTAMPVSLRPWRVIIVIRMIFHRTVS